jgi:hypothetical protein
MVNAVQHGNLSIGYEEKGRLLAKRKLESEMKRRMSHRDYRDRRAQLTIERAPGVMIVTIRDEGPGFDYERYMTLDKNRLFDSHGRGVLLASSTLNLRYIPPGNQVEVQLPLSR